MTALVQYLKQRHGANFQGPPSHIAFFFAVMWLWETDIRTLSTALWALARLRWKGEAFERLLDIQKISEHSKDY